LGELSFSFVAPPLIRLIVDEVDAKNHPLYVGLFFALVYTCAPLVQTLCLTHYITTCRRVGLRAWGATSCMVFEKTLRMSQPASVEHGAGKIVNVMQVDTARLDYAFFYLNYLWSMPAMLVVGVTLL